MAYIDCFVAPVQKSKREAYLAFTKIAAAVFKEHGATKLVDYWGDDIPPGQIMSFPLAVKCTSDETVTVSLIAWPSKAAREDGNAKAMADARMRALDLPFDGKRAIMGGFETIHEI